MKVLCVNDNQVTLRHTTHIIEKSEIAEEVIIASNIREALSYYSIPQSNSISQNLGLGKNEYPKMIFIDMHMPEHSVWDFLDQFTKSYLPIYPDTKVIITSYTLDPEDSEKAKEYDCVMDFIPYC
jgi:CheY-like chemotaxis protein